MGRYDNPAAGCTLMPPTVTPAARVLAFAIAPAVSNQDTEMGPRTLDMSATSFRDFARRVVVTGVILVSASSLGIAPGGEVSATVQPTVAWNTFLGSGSDWSYGVAVAASGDVYVSGRSWASWENPIRPFTTGADAGNTDAFVAKLSPSGALIWNTFLGGAGTDEGRGIAVDASGNVYVTGVSDAAWGNPIRNFTMLEGYEASEAFAVKLSPNGDIVWSTFLGGWASDAGYGITVDGSGNAFVTGNSYAAWDSPFGSFGSARQDAFVAKLLTSGSLAWTTYLGEHSDERGVGIGLDGGGNVYVAGFGLASWDSPVEPFADGFDTFVAKLRGDGTFVWNTFLGGTDHDIPRALSIDGSGNAYVTGKSHATWGAPLCDFGEGTDAFVAKVDTGGAVAWNTFLGGSGADDGQGIAVTSTGVVHVTGESSAGWGDSGWTFSGLSDAFTIALTPAGELLDGTLAFLGGVDRDNGTSIAADLLGRIFVVGGSRETWGNPVRPLAGTYGVFVAKVAGLPVGTTIQLVAPYDGATVRDPTPALRFRPGGSGGYSVYIAEACTQKVDARIVQSIGLFPNAIPAPSLLTAVPPVDLRNEESYEWWVESGDRLASSPVWMFSLNGRGSRQKRAERLTVPKRFQIVEEFFGEFGGGDGLGFGTAIDHFMDWEFFSERLDRSRWWRSVNGMMILDMADAQRIIRRARSTGLTPTSSRPSVQAWITFAIASSGEDRQQLFWHAHNRSIHLGDRASRFLLKTETPAERAFIETVVINVDIAGLANFSSRGDTLESFGFDFYVNTFYPPEYPTRLTDADLADLLADLVSASGNQLEYLKALRLIGQCATAWPPPGFGG